MEHKEVLMNLCMHDPRNPDNKDDPEFADVYKAREKCYCDNCFYGRTRLALEILRIKGGG